MRGDRKQMNAGGKGRVWALTWTARGLAQRFDGGTNVSSSHPHPLAPNNKGRKRCWCA